MREGDHSGLGRGTGAFVGRLGELAQLRAKLDEVRAGEPRVVLIQGPPGIGKTALIQRFLEEALELRVLRASGAQEEHLLPYGVAQQLASSARIPLAERLATLGSGPDRDPEPFAVGADFVDVLGSLQADGPVAVVIDDVQWADRPSQLAILFALRRLQADRVLALLVARERDTAGLPEGLLKLCVGTGGATLRLGGLDASDLQRLAAAISGEQLPTELAERLRYHTDGSPLHLRALLEELPLERLRNAGDAPLPCPRPFAMQVLSQLAACPAVTRRLIVAASVLGLECRLSLAQHLACVVDPLVALEGAISVGLLEARDLAGDHGLAFPHALIRAAIYHDIGPAPRATLHLKAAKLVGDEAASLWHRTLATVGEDDVLANDLADYARREDARGAWSRAAAALLRASRLTSSPELREQRLLDGVDRLIAAGETTKAATYTEEVRGYADGPKGSYVLGRIAHYAGRHSEGYESLLRAWDRCDPIQDPKLASKIAEDVALVLARRARGPDLVTWARRATHPSGTSLPHSALANGLAFSGRAHEGLAGLDALPEAPSELRAENMDRICARGTLRFITDDLEGARHDFALVIQGAAQWGPFLVRLIGLSLLAAVDYRLGDWDAAVAHGEAAVSIAEATDQNFVLSYMHAAASPPLSGRGQWEEAEAHVRAAIESARAVNDACSIADAAVAQAQLAAARCDHEAVVAALDPIAAMPQREGIDEPGTRWTWQELYADALVCLGRLDEGEAALAPFEARAAARERRSAMVNAARVRGNLEAARRRFDLAESAFRAGLEHSDVVPLPFDRARLEAAYGRFHRRLGRRASAVNHLKAASAQFAQLGARPYSESCDHVLHLCGVVANRHERQRASLTPPEVAVARLVSQGLSNRDVAAQLVVSVNTVEYHLKNIYSKLGIFSRRQLAGELGALGWRSEQSAGGTTLEVSSPRPTR